MAVGCIYSFMKIAEAAELVSSGKSLVLCGDEKALSQIPKGNWIGGTTCYFTIDGKYTENRDGVYIAEFPPYAKLKSINCYKEQNVQEIINDASDNGFTVFIIPAGSEPSLQYSKFAPTYQGLFLKPVIGWIAGVHLNELDDFSAKKITPKVFNGQTGESGFSLAVAMHFNLPDDKFAVIKTINPFMAKKDSPVIRFSEQNSLVIRDATVDGKVVNLPQYILENKIDYRFPMQANYNGTLINISLPPKIEGHEIQLHQAVFSDIDYRFTELNPEYKDIENANSYLDKEKFIVSCSCMLNALNFNVNGSPKCGLDGPLTFGEIAYQPVGNTSVYLEIEE